MKPTIESLKKERLLLIRQRRQLNAEMQSLRKVSQGEIARLVARNLETENYRERVETERDELRREKLGADTKLDHVEDARYTAESQLAEYRASVLEWFMASSNCVTRDNTEYMISLAARVSGQVGYRVKPEMENTRIPNPLAKRDQR